MKYKTKVVFFGYVLNNLVSRHKFTLKHIIVYIAQDFNVNTEIIIFLIIVKYFVKMIFM